MAETRLPGDISRPESILPTTPVGTGGGALNVPTQSFSSFMKGGTPSPMMAAGKGSMISPFEMMQPPTRLPQVPTLDTLVTQVNSAQSTLGDISTQLNTPNLKLKPSTKYLVKNKMNDANTNLRAANDKMGAPLPEETEPSKFSGPLGKFFAYLTDGQAQLASAKDQLQSLKDKGDQITPGDFLMIQVKLGKAQQELEFTSVLLSNAVSDIKMLMQVQL